MGASPRQAGDVSFDPIERIIRRNGIRIPITRKAAAILSCLLENQGRIVTHVQLLKAVWQDTFVQTNSIKIYIFELRRALADSARNPTHIESIARRGYRLIGPLAEEEEPTSPRGNAGEVHPPGRQGEIEILNDCLAEARNGTMQIVFVDGEPGMGKTTLVESFAAEAGPDVHVLSGRCTRTQGREEPYAAVLEALGKLKIEGFPRLLARHAPTWALKMPELFAPQEREALRLQTANATPARMLRELCELIEAISQTALLLVVLDDVHEADSATLDFVNTVAARQQPGKLLLICTVLPAALLSAGHPLGTICRELSVKAQCRNVKLRPLAPASVRAILMRGLGTQKITDDLLRKVMESSGGNPLFIGSIVTHLKEGRFPRSQVAVDVCDDLRRIVLHQFAELSPEERVLLEYAAVAGASFYGGSISPLLNCTPDAADARYEALAESRRWIRVAVATTPAGPVHSTRFEFTLGAYRGIIYGQIEEVRRNEIHRAIAVRAGQAIP